MNQQQSDKHLAVREGSSYVPNPRKMAHDVARTRRANALRHDANLLYEAASVARRHNCPALDNSLTVLARTLSKQADDTYRGLEDVPVRKDLL